LIASLELVRQGLYHLRQVSSLAIPPLHPYLSPPPSGTQSSPKAHLRFIQFFRILSTWK
jgi:hypothetical protein